MDNVKYLKLKNGLECIYEKMAGVNTVAIFFVVKIGSGNEAKGEEGISHFLEHLIFKGTDTLSAFDITNQIEKLGGSINAYTSIDETAYYAYIPKRNWKQGLNILSEILFNNSFSEDDFINEKRVILEELKSGKDNPYKILSEETFNLTYHYSPYKHPIIGFEETVSKFTPDDVKSYYKKFYNPQNISLIVVGDIKFNDFKSEIPRLEQFQKISLKSRKDKPKEEIQVNTNFICKVGNFNQNYINVAFRLPGGFFKDFVELEILSLLLGGFEDSLLKERLKDELKLVTEIYTYIISGVDFSTFIIHISAPLEISPNKILNTLFVELNNFQNSTISQDKILKAVINYKSDKIFSKESAAGRAKSILYYQIFSGSYENEDKFIKALDHIESSKLQHCSKKYFSIDKANIVLLSDRESEVKLDTKRDKSGVHKLNDDNRLLFTLNNGIRVVFKKIDRIPAVAFNLVALGGLKFETEVNNGISHLMAKTIMSNSENLSEKEIENKFDFYSGTINAFSGKNSVGVQSIVLSEFFPDAFNIFLNLVRYPSFNQSHFEKKRRDIIEDIKTIDDDIYQKTINFFYKKIFEGNYYAMPLNGTLKSIKKISKRDLFNLYSRVMKSENMVFGFTGDLKNRDIDFVCSRLETITREQFEYQPLILNSKNSYRYFEEKTNKNQLHLVGGFLAPTLRNRENIYFKVLNSIMGNQSGRLFQKVREELGICYSIFSFYFDAFEGGAFGMYIATSPENKKLAMDKLKSLSTELVNSGVSRDELEKSINYIKGSIDNFSQKYINVNSKISYNVLYGLGIDYDIEFLKLLDSIEIDKLNALISEYFNPDNFTYVVLEP